MSRVVLFLTLVVASVAHGLAPTLMLSDGNAIPQFALGTGRGTATDRQNVSEVRDAVLWALKLGYRHIDTAAAYNDEREVGQGIRDAIDAGVVQRKDVFVTTKLWNDRHAKDQVVPALRESLERLGLQSVDLYLVHFPVAINEDGSPASIDYLETWEGMVEAKRLGLTRSIGVSNFNSEQVARLLDHTDVPPVVNQFEVNPTLSQERLVSFCQERGVAVMAYSPFGFLVSRRAEHRPPPRLDDPLLLKIAERYGKTTPQVVLRYLVDRQIIPVAKSTNEKRLSENIDIFDFQLSKEDISDILKFNKNIRVIEPKLWERYPNYPFGNETSLGE